MHPSSLHDLLRMLEESFLQADEKLGKACSTFENARRAYDQQRMCYRMVRRGYEQFLKELRDSENAYAEDRATAVRLLKHYSMDGWGPPEDQVHHEA